MGRHEYREQRPETQTEDRVVGLRFVEHRHGELFDGDRCARGDDVVTAGAAQTEGVPVVDDLSSLVGK